MRAFGAVLCTALAVSSCAHVREGSEPLELTERVMRDACIAFVVDGVDVDEVGRRLGGYWHRNWPDPFSPPLGPYFRRGSATLQVVDGRRFRDPDGRPTRAPLRSCNLWLPAQDEALFVDAVTSAARARPDARLLQPAVIDDRLRIVACIPSASGHTAVVSAIVYRNNRVGAGVIESLDPPPACVP